MRHVTAAHRDLLRRIGSGQPLWPLLYEWQAVRQIPEAFFRPETTVTLLTRRGLIVVEGDRVRLTPKGAELASRLQEGASTPRRRPL